MNLSKKLDELKVNAIVARRVAGQWVAVVKVQGSDGRFTHGEGAGATFDLASSEAVGSLESANALEKT